MLIDGHVRYRFAQRILRIENKNKIDKYISQNMFEVNYRIIEFVNNAELLIENYAPNRKDTLDYYINGEVLIIINKNKEIETLFHITLDSENQSNSRKIKQYVKDVRRNNNKIKQLKIEQKKQNLITKHFEYMLEYLGDDINLSVKERIENDRGQSINKCKELAAQEKELRLENRELMSEMFIKIEMK